MNSSDSLHSLTPLCPPLRTRNLEADTSTGAEDERELSATGFLFELNEFLWLYTMAVVCRGVEKVGNEPTMVQRLKKDKRFAQVWYCSSQCQSI